MQKKNIRKAYKNYICIYETYNMKMVQKWANILLSTRQYSKELYRYCLILQQVHEVGAVIPFHGLANSTGRWNEWPKTTDLGMTEFRFIPRDFASRVCDCNYPTIQYHFCKVKEKKLMTHVYTQVYCWYMPRRPEKIYHHSPHTGERLISIEYSSTFSIFKCALFFFKVSEMSRAWFLLEEGIWKEKRWGAEARSHRHLPPSSNCLSPRCWL